MLGKIDWDEPKKYWTPKIAEMVEDMADWPGNPKDVSHEQQQAQGEMPSESTDMKDEVPLEEGPHGSTETRMSTRGTREHYIGSPDRLRKEKSKGDPDDMDEGDNKNRRVNSKIEAMMCCQDHLTTSQTPN